MNQTFESCDHEHEQWVDQLKQGINPTENANRLYLLFAPWVLGFFRRRLKGASFYSLQECEDLTQEVFSKVFDSLDSYSGTGSFRSWLFAIAVNTLRSKWASEGRQKRKAPEVSIDDPEDSLQDPPRARAPLAEDQLLHRERAREVRRAIADLPVQMRRCAELHFFEGYSYRDIATLLRVQESSVRVQVHNARKRLRALFSETRGSK